MTILLGDVHVDNLGADDWSVKSATTRVRVHTRSMKIAIAIGRALAIAEGLVGGVVGTPCECPICGSVRTEVKDSRPVRDTVRRRRRCRACEARWTTEEKTLVVDASGCKAGT